MQKATLKQCYIENWPTMAGAEANKLLETVLKLVKERANYYKAENERMEAVFKDLHLMDGQGNLPKGIEELLERLSKIQENSGAQNLTENDVILSHFSQLDEERARKKYICTLKVYTKLYNNMNLALGKRIEDLKKEFENAEKNVHEIAISAPSELISLQKKIDKYESELVNLEKSLPWLKDPEYDLENIAKEIEILTSAKKKKEELEKEVNQFHGLEPDLKRAEEQVAHLKAECSNYNK